MICNNIFFADILRVCEIKDLIWVMRFKSPLVYEPVHEISNVMVCATSKASDQPAHTHMPQNVERTTAATTIT